MLFGEINDRLSRFVELTSKRCYRSHESHGVHILVVFSSNVVSWRQDFAHVYDPKLGLAVALIHILFVSKIGEL